jgi:hypothetical protein
MKESPPWGAVARCAMSEFPELGMNSGSKTTGGVTIDWPSVVPRSRRRDSDFRQGGSERGRETGGSAGQA